jgi:cytochrome c oxidase assembly protein subunit 11
LSRTLRTAMLLGVLVIGMVGLGYASVPLYRMFCQATGLNGTTNRGRAAPGGIGQKMLVTFDTNVSPKLPWTFKPEAKSDTVDIGARDMAFFDATNNSDHPITGTATYNVTPAEVGRYFTKIQCFCFTQQTLKPHETAHMPVIFFVDPRIATDPDTKDVQTITLSYTFYPVDSARKPG